MRKFFVPGNIYAHRNFLDVVMSITKVYKVAETGKYKLKVRWLLKQGLHYLGSANVVVLAKDINNWSRVG